MVSSLYHSERIALEITKFKDINNNISYQIEDKQRQYIKSILPSSQELMRKENFGEVLKGEQVIIIKENNTDITIPNVDNLSKLNFPQRWLLFITGINQNK